MKLNICNYSLISGLILFFSFGLGLQAKAMPTDADSINQLRIRAVECQLRGDKQAAMELHRQAANIAYHAFGANSSYLAEMYYDIGVLAFSDSNFNKAEESFNQAIRVNPNYYPARLKLAELMHLRGHPDNAVRECQLVLAKHRGNVQAREVLSASYQDLGHPYKSVRECYYLDQALHGKLPPAPVIAVAPVVVVAPAVSQQAAAQLQKDKQQADIRKKEAIKAAQKAERSAKKAEKAVKKSKDKKAPPQEKTAVVNLESKAASAPVAKKPKNAPVVKAATPPKKSVKENVPAQSTPVESDGSESNSSESENASEETKPPVQKAVPAKLPKAAPIVVDVMPKPKRPRGGLVPPPPPVVPVYAPMVPMTATQARPVKQTAKVKPEKPKEKAVDSVKDDKPQAAPDEKEKDDDFLLDWGGAGAKAKKK